MRPPADRRETARTAGLVVTDEPCGVTPLVSATETAKAVDPGVRGTPCPRKRILALREILEGKRYGTLSAAHARGQAQPGLHPG